MRARASRLTRSGESRSLPVVAAALPALVVAIVVVHAAALARPTITLRLAIRPPSTSAGTRPTRARSTIRTRSTTRTWTAKVARRTARARTARTEATAGSTRTRPPRPAGLPLPRFGDGEAAATDRPTVQARDGRGELLRRLHVHESKPARPPRLAIDDDLGRAHGPKLSEQAREVGLVEGERKVANVCPGHGSSGDLAGTRDAGREDESGGTVAGRSADSGLQAHATGYRKSLAGAVKNGQDPQRPPHPRFLARDRRPVLRIEFTARRAARPPPCLPHPSVPGPGR